MPSPNHTDISRSIGHLEGRMEGLEKKIVDGFESIHAKIDAALGDHESRIRGLEQTQQEQHGAWRLLAVIGAISAAVGGLIAGFWNYIFGATP